MVTKSIEMNHKDHVRKTQLDWVFCVQNFLDATLALELLVILEWWATPGLVYRFNAFTNSPIGTRGSCAWGTGIFSLFAHFATCNLKQFRWICIVFPQKWQTHKGLSCNLSLGRVGFLRLDSLRSTIIFLRGGVASTDLTISLLGGLEEETKFVEWVSDIEMLFAIPRPVLSKGDF